MNDQANNGQNLLSVIVEPVMSVVEWPNDDGLADCWPGRINEQKGGRVGSEVSFSTASLWQKDSP